MSATLTPTPTSPRPQKQRARVISRLEVGLGLTAAALAIIGLGFAVFAPATYSYGTNWLTGATVSLWDQGIDSASVLIYLAVMVVAALGIGTGVYLHSRGLGAGALVVLWASVLVFAVGAALTLPGDNTAVVPSALHTGTPDSVGIGVYLLPPAAVAIATAIVSTSIRHRSDRGITVRTH